MRFLLLGILLLASCYRGTTALSEKESYITGKAVTAKLIKGKNLFTETDLINYVNDIGFSLALASPRPEIYSSYQFVLVTSNEPFIWSTVGGFIIISTRMIKECSSEDQLAAILAHSMSHLCLWHHDEEALKSKKQVESKVYGGFIKEPLDEREKELVRKAFSGQVDALSLLAMSGFDIEREMEADNLAIEMLHKLGYATDGIHDILDRIPINQSCLKRPDERLNNLKNQAKEPPKFELGGRKRRFQENTIKVKGLLDGFLRTERISKEIHDKKLAVEIQLRNTTDKKLSGTWFIEFYDDHGILLLSERREESFMAKPFDVITLRNTCLLPSASQFWIDIKLK